MTENRRHNFESTINELQGDVAHWQNEIQRANALIADLRERGDAMAYAPSPSPTETTPTPKKRKRRKQKLAVKKAGRGRPKKGTQNSADVNEGKQGKVRVARKPKLPNAEKPWLAEGISKSSYYRRQRAASPTPETPSPSPISAQSSEPSPSSGWTRDPHTGILSREHSALPESPLTGKKPDNIGRSRRSNADATA